MAADKDIDPARDFPQMPENNGIFLTALSVFIMSFSSFVPILPILLFYGLWFSQIYYQKNFILRPTYTLIPLGLFALLCVYSTFWSAVPSKTLYYGLEFVSFFMCAIIASRVTSCRAFLKGAALGIGLVLLINLLSNNYNTVYYSGKPALIGFFGNKNQVGVVAACGFLLSFLFFFYARGAKEKIIYSVLPIIISFVCLYLSLSKASLLSAIGALFIVGVMYCISKLPTGLRGVLISLLIIASMAVGLLIYIYAGEIYFFMLDVLEKDPTMSGRTWLWARGIERGLENPFTGYGYKGFWFVGQPYAEFYWKEFGIDHKDGFHFHNLYIETFVELGFIGLTLMMFFFLSAFVKITHLVSRYGLSLESSLFIGVVTLFFIRSMASVEQLGPFGIQLFLFYTIYLKLIEFKANKKVLQNNE